MTDVNTKPIVDLKTLFVPVIFANGIDDDLPGLLAAFMNEAVQFEDHIYQPRDRIVIIGKVLLIDSRKGAWVDDGDTLLIVFGPENRSCVIKRPMSIPNCFLTTRAF